MAVWICIEQSPDGNLINENFDTDYDTHQGIKIIAFNKMLQNLCYLFFGDCGTGYSGLQLEHVVLKLYQKHINTQTKKDVVYTVVHAVEQIYKDLHGEEKLNKALEAASEMLKAQGITVTELELKMLIESAVGEFNGVFAGEAETAPAVIAGMTAE